MQLNIQLLRFLATMAVVLCHAAPHYTAAGGTGFATALQYLPIAGNVGVDVFFVISGYVLWITTSHTNGVHAVGRFAYRRLTRVYLGYWPCLLMVVAMHAYYSVGTPQPYDLWGSIFLTQNRSQLLLLPVAWTLAYEIYFYTVFAGLLFFQRRYRLALLSAWGLLFFLAMVLLWRVLNGRQHQFQDEIITACGFALSSYCLDFIGGCFLAYYLEKEKKIPVMMCAALSCALVGIAAYWQAHDSAGAHVVMDYPYRRAALFGVAALALVAVAVGLERKKQVFFPALALLLGDITYSVYLSHTILLEWLYHLGVRTAVLEREYSPELFIMLAILFVIVYGMAHFRCIEKPLMQLSRLLVTRRLPR